MTPLFYAFVALGFLGLWLILLALVRQHDENQRAKESQNPPSNDEVWGQIKSGGIKGYSIGIIPTATHTASVNGKTVTVMDKVEVFTSGFIYADDFSKMDEEAKMRTPMYYGAIAAGNGLAGWVKTSERTSEWTVENKNDKTKTYRATRATYERPAKITVAPSAVIDAEWKLRRAQEAWDTLVAQWCKEYPQLIIPEFITLHGDPRVKAQEHFADLSEWGSKAAEKLFAAVSSSDSSVFASTSLQQQREAYLRVHRDLAKAKLWKEKLYQVHMSLFAAKRDLDEAMEAWAKAEEEKA